MEAAVEVERRAVGELPKHSPRGPRRTLLGLWKREEWKRWHGGT